MINGWVHTRSIRNNAHVGIRVPSDRSIEGTSLEVTGVDFDNGSEFINRDVIVWLTKRNV